MNKIGFILLFILIVSSAFYVSRSKLVSTSEENRQPIAQEKTVDPFEDMTIPFLRSRNYTSSLGEKIKYQTHENYVSYLTTYQSDNLKIQSLITIPSGSAPEGGWPAIVFVHGYIPPTLYKTTEKYIDYVDYLARNGFVVLKIDLRGHGSSEGEPGGAYYSSDYVVDTLNAYSALENSDFVNKNKIGLWGHSMAGNIVLRSVAAKPTIPAAVIWAGAGYTYSDLVTYGLQDNSYRPPQTANRQNQKRQLLIQTHGQPNIESSFWKQVIPTNYLTDFQGAIELHQAKDDLVVSPKYNEDLNSLLDSTKIPHEFYEYLSGGHNISGTSFSTAMSRTVDFYHKYL